MCSDDEEGAGGANVRIVRPRTPRTALGKFAAAAPSTRSAATAPAAAAKQPRGAKAVPAPAAKRSRVVLAYTTAEKVGGSRWRNAVLTLLVEDRLRLIVLDEGHLVNSWGRTFRPSIAELGAWLDNLVAEANGRRRIARLSQLRPPARLVATATCPQHAEVDLVRSFRLGAGHRVFRSLSRRWNLELFVGPLQIGHAADVVAAKLHRMEVLDEDAQDERASAMVFCITIKNAAVAVAKQRDGSGLPADAYDVMHSKLTPAEKHGRVERFKRGELQALTGTAIMQMGIDKSRVLCVMLAQLPLSLPELYQAMGRAGRGTLELARIEVVFDTACISGILALITADPIGLAEFTAVIEFVVDMVNCKHSFISEALGDVKRPVRARPRQGCCSACSGLYLNNAPLQQLDVTAQVVAICATIEHLAWTTGKAPTFLALLKAPRSSPLGDWAGNERRWTPEARAHLILSLVGLRAVRILRFASLEPDASAAPPGFRTYNYPSAPLAVNPDALAEYVHSARRIVLSFPAAIYPKRKP